MLLVCWVIYFLQASAPLQVRFSTKPLFWLWCGLPSDFRFCKKIYCHSCSSLTYQGQRICQRCHAQITDTKQKSDTSQQDISRVFTWRSPKTRGRLSLSQQVPKPVKKVSFRPSSQTFKTDETKAKGRTVKKNFKFAQVGGKVQPNEHKRPDTSNIKKRNVKHARIKFRSSSYQSASPPFWHRGMPHS